MKRMMIRVLATACILGAASLAFADGQPRPKSMDLGDNGMPGGASGTVDPPPPPTRTTGSVKAHARFESGAGAYVAMPGRGGRTDLRLDCSRVAATAKPAGSVTVRLKGVMDFRSTEIEEIALRDSWVQLDGKGTIHKAGSYHFRITALDGPAGADRVRVRITDPVTDAVVYDSQMGAADDTDPATPLTGGWIQVVSNAAGESQALVHELIEPLASAAAEPAPLAMGLSQSWPNPFRARTQMRFSLPRRGIVKLAVYDVAGREVASLADGPWDAGSHIVAWSGKTASGATARGGVYFARMAGRTAGGEVFVCVRKMVLQD